MPPVKPRPREETEPEDREFQEQLAAREPWLANGAVATTVHDWGELVFPEGSGIRYLVPPVPHRNGQQIHLLDRLLAWCARELDALEKDGKTVLVDPMARWLADHLAKSYEALADEYVKVVRPANWRARWALRGGRNPFRDATIAEIQELARLFQAAQTTSRVRAVTSIWAPRYLRSTWPTSLPSLWLNIPPGLRRKGARAVGATMSSGVSA